MYLTEQDIAGRYAASLQSMREIAVAYYFQGRIEDAFGLWQCTEHLLEGREAQAAQHVDVLLHYGQFLIHRYFLIAADDNLMHGVIQRALRAAQASQDEAAIATALYLVGQSQYYQNLLTGGTDYTTARSNLEHASALREKVGDGYGLAESLFYTGLTYDRQRPDERTREYLQRVLVLGEQYGNTWAISEALRHMTDYTEGDERLRYALRSLELREEMGFVVGLVSAQLLVSEIYLARGELSQALEYCQRAERLSQELGLSVYLMYALLTRSEIEHKRGHPAEAREYLEKGRTMARELNMDRRIAIADEKQAMLRGEQQTDEA